MEKSTKHSQPPPFVVEPTAQHQYSLILLHGLGSNGENFGNELIETGICSNGKKLVDIFPGARFIFPTSKKRRSTAFGRAKLTQWFDIKSLDDPSHRQDGQVRGLTESSREILELVNEESKKIPRERIILGGLSQGCAAALICLLTLDLPLGGFVGMSGWLPFQGEIKKIAEGDEGVDDDSPSRFDRDDPFSDSDEELSGDQDPISEVVAYVRDLLGQESLKSRDEAISLIRTPVFLGHGELDDKIKPRLGQLAGETLVSCGFRVTWKSYRDQGHWYKIPDEIDDLVEFIQTQVGYAGKEDTGTERNEMEILDN
ncbi:acyl-protein thioesterase [Hypoxylon sp. FL0543]|nr:acyl-protein thioesterase [Hypoxylon sp. FL0543]